MSLSLVVSSGVETAFQLAGDFVRLGTYFSMPDGSQSTDYDPTTDTIAGPRATLNNIRMLRVKQDEREIEASAAAKQQVKFLVPAADLPSITPKGPDEILFNGTRYNVLQADTVPGDSLWIILAVRK